jgi:hypothetical protein
VQKPGERVRDPVLVPVLVLVLVLVQLGRQPLPLHQRAQVQLQRE